MKSVRTTSGPFPLRGWQRARTRSVRKVRERRLGPCLVLVGLLGAASQAPPASASPADAEGRVAELATATFHYGRGLYEPTYGLGLEYPVAPNRSAAIDWELSPTSGVIAPKASYRLQLTAPRFVTVAATFGVTTALVFRDALNAGFGPRVGLGVALGREWLRLDLAGQAGAEIFVHEFGPRIPVRAVGTLRSTVAGFTAGVSVRAGYDFEPSRYTLPRFEALAFVGTNAFDER